jgi:hypothetical protein
MDIIVEFNESEKDKIKWLHIGDQVNFQARIVDWSPYRPITAENGRIVKISPRIIDH